VQHGVAARVVAVHGERHRHPQQRRSLLAETLAQELDGRARGHVQFHRLGAKSLTHGGEATHGDAHELFGHRHILLPRWPSWLLAG
jgi:hypothetical protein